MKGFHDARNFEIHAENQNPFLTKKTPEEQVQRKRDVHEQNDTNLQNSKKKTHYKGKKDKPGEKRDKPRQKRISISKGSKKESTNQTPEDSVPKPSAKPKSYIDQEKLKHGVLFKEEGTRRLFQNATAPLRSNFQKKNQKCAANFTEVLFKICSLIFLH